MLRAHTGVDWLPRRISTPAFEAALWPESPVRVRVEIKDLLEAVFKAVMRRTGCPRDLILWPFIPRGDNISISILNRVFRVAYSVVPGWRLAAFPREGDHHLEFVIDEETVLAEHLPVAFLPRVVLSYL